MIGWRLGSALAGLFFLSVSFAVPSGSLKRVAYFIEWGVYDRQYEIADIPANQLTHLLYAFAVINPETHECEIYDRWAALQKIFGAKNDLSEQSWEKSEQDEAGNFDRLRVLKIRYPHLKILLSVGGATRSSEFSDAVTDEIDSLEMDSDHIEQAQTHRHHLVQSCVALMNQYGFDGLDYDWEFPVEGGAEHTEHRSQDKQNFTALLQETRAALKPGQELTVAVTSDVRLIKNLEVERINTWVDAIHVMAYNFHKEWSPFTGHLASLYPVASHSFETELNRQALSVDAVIKAYIAAGAFPQKLVLGVPLYGRAWVTKAHHESHGLYQAAALQKAPHAAFPLPGNWEDGNFDFWKVNQLIQTGQLKPYYDGVAHAAYAYSPETGLFISYETVQTVKEKIEYVHAHHLGGMMVWELSGDLRKNNPYTPEILAAVPEDSLVRVIDENLK